MSLQHRLLSHFGISYSTEQLLLRTPTSMDWFLYDWKLRHKIVNTINLNERYFLVVTCRAYCTVKSQKMSLYPFSKAPKPETQHFCSPPPPPSPLLPLSKVPFRRQHPNYLITGFQRMSKLARNGFLSCQFQIAATVFDLYPYYSANFSKYNFFRDLREFYVNFLIF